MFPLMRHLAGLPESAALLVFEEVKWDPHVMVTRLEPHQVCVWGGGFSCVCVGGGVTHVTFLPFEGRYISVGVVHTRHGHTSGATPGVWGGDFWQVWGCSLAHPAGKYCCMRALVHHSVRVRPL
jgi:hypothetical protein